MKLSKDQIAQLFTFTQQHYVEYYDVQLELVDHMANDIEAIWAENPKLTFEQVRDKSFKKFGVFGFYDVVSQKEKEMTKRYFRIVIRFLKEWFKIPKIIFTLILSFILFKIQNFSYGYYMYSFMLYGIVLIQFLYIIRSGIRKRNRENKTTKKWLFENILNTQGIGIIAIFLLTFFDYPSHRADMFLEMSVIRGVFSASVLTFIIILGYITIFIIPKKTQQLLRETYPEYENYRRSNNGAL